MVRFLGIFLSAFLLAGAASAQISYAPPDLKPAPTPNRFEIGAYAGYLFGSSADGHNETGTSSASLEGAPSYGGIVGFRVQPNAFVELSYWRQQTELSLRQSTAEPYRYDLLLQYFQIGGLLEFPLPTVPWLLPTFGGTLGATVFTASDDQRSYDEVRFSVIFEGGTKIRLTKFLGLRLRARAFLTFLVDEGSLFCAGGLGCAYAYSGSALLQGELGGGAYVSF
jgi:hypothetical protein